MSSILRFFLNALKAIFFSPFYLLVFLCGIIFSLFNHLYGEVRILVSGFKYGSKKENKYYRAAEKRRKQLKNGGGN